MTAADRAEHSALLDQRVALSDERTQVENDHSAGLKESGSLALQIEEEQQRLEELGHSLKHLERSKQTGHKSYSCCCLKQNNRLRHLCHDVTSHWVFEAFIFAAIIASSACLTYRPETEPWEVVWLGNACTILFILEFAMRVIDTNFVEYMSHGWNALDFIIVMAAILEYVIEVSIESDGMVDLSLLKIMRMLRSASLALAPSPLIFSYKSEKSLCGAGCSAHCVRSSTSSS